MNPCLLGSGKNALIVGSLFGLATIDAPGALAATTTANLAASTTVTSNCSISTTPLAFGNVNTRSGAAADATGTIAVNCTNGTNWASSAGPGAGSGATTAVRKMTAGTDTLSYAIYTDAQRTRMWGDFFNGTEALAGTGTGSSQTVTFYGRIFAGQSSARIATYSDTVVVQLDY